MAKVTFSARKDPLLRPRRPSKEPSHTRRAATEKPVDAQPASPAGSPAPDASPPTRPAKSNAVEGPPGVIAVSPERPAGQRRRRSGTSAGDSAKTSEPTEATPRAERSRHAARRVQTSVSLPPDSWDALDELGREAGVSAGQLLTAILTTGIPETPQAALTALEQLLVSIPSDEGPHEERNYRLPLDLRNQLDELAKALDAGPRIQRSMLIRAILTSHLPKSGEQARELITTRRLDAMRAALATSATH